MGTHERLAVTSYSTDDKLAYILIGAVAVGAAFRIFKVQNRLWLYTSLSDVTVIAAAAASGVLLVTASVAILLPDAVFSRAVPVLHFLFVLLPIVALRILVRSLRNSRYLAGAHRKGFSEIKAAGNGPDHVIIVGANSLAELYLRAVSELARESIEVVGIVDEDPAKHRHQIRSQEILGRPQDLSGILQELRIRGIVVKSLVVCCQWTALSQPAQDALRAHGKDWSLRFVFLNKFLDLMQSGQVRPVYATDLPNRAAPLPEPRQARVSDYLKIKRGVDFVLALGLSIVLSPVLLVVALVVATNLGVPCLFWQKRPGYRGRVFKVYKFRTMRSPCDADGNRIPDERRQTVVSRLLRRLRLDELPQLYNVLKGDMALIGPRPLLPVDLPQGASLRQQLRPGVTGWAQVNGGRLLGAEEKLALDLWYARHASFWLDMKIVLLSLLMVVRGEREDRGAIREAVAELNASLASPGADQFSGRYADFDPVELDRVAPQGLPIGAVVGINGSPRRHTVRTIPERAHGDSTAEERDSLLPPEPDRIAPSHEGVSQQQTETVGTEVR